MRPYNHLQGQGCPTCRLEGMLVRQQKGGYTYAYFENNAEEKTKPAIFYVAKICNKNETMIKIGISVTSFEQRYCRTEYKNMTITPLLIKNMPLYEAFNIEQQLIQKLQQSRFFTNHEKFSGYTECFKYSPIIANLIETFATGINI